MQLTNVLSLIIVYLAIGLTTQNDCNSFEHSTLCQLNNGTQACCPIKDASCCSTGDFCCPNGFKCDIDNGRCIKDSLYIPFHLRMSEIKQLENNICPDGDSECPSGSTCCDLGDGEYGCCGVEDAICCDDHVSCCPQGYTCETDKGRCEKGDISLPIYTKIKSIKSTKKIDKNVICPDKLSECPNGSTCCQMEDGSYGCCGVENAVCCNDHESCCPQGYTCETDKGRCNKGDLSLPVYTKIKSIAKKLPTKHLDQIVCPDGISTCPSQATCCLSQSGFYACCPFANATCCDDKLHCCPHAMTCDTIKGRCNKGDISIPFQLKTESIKIKNNPTPDELVCPNKKSVCAPETTCCLLAEGAWGCCPMPNAVCCKDDLHCCPENYSCDAESKKCTNGLISIPFYRKIEAKIKEIEEIKNEIKISNSSSLKLGSVVCPDGCSFCPKDTTCCQMCDGSYGCCPMVNAVCCGDHLHCCPENTKCDLQKGGCVNSDNFGIEWFEKEKATKMNPQAQEVTILLDPLTCPDNITTCDARATCCKERETNSYGCCPYAKGVCCENSAFCCPENTECTKNPGECLPKKKIIEKTPYINWHSIEEKAKNLDIAKRNVASDSDCQSQCNKTDGTFGCCPYVNGTCCGTHGWCCPNGYNCDPKLEVCTLIDPDNNSKKTMTPLQIDKKSITNKYSLRRRLSLFEPVGSVECSDGIHLCPDTYSCCIKKYTDHRQTEYGCCPVKDAVCCDDGVNCCPQGYECTNGNALTTCRKL